MDKLKEECGIFGIFRHNDSAALTALALHSLQHRGQEGCGIVTFDGKKFYSERRLGLVGDNFTKGDGLKNLPGDSAIGHNRYSTSGNNLIKNIQPFFADLHISGISIAHNGNLSNARYLRKELVKNGSIFQTTSDTETIVQLIAKSKRPKIVDKIIDSLFQIQGGYALTILTNDKLIGIRDPLGIRPLVIGKLNKSYVLASETCAFDIIGAKYIRKVENGEIVIITKDGLESIKPFPKIKERPCIFEYIYFSRPDSIINNLSVYEYRKKFGAELAKESHVESDLIIPVPDSGVPAAIGYSEKIKNEVKRITLKLLSKLDVLDGNKSIIIEPITIADKMPSKFTEVRNQIEFLLINEMFEFGIPVMDYSRKNKGSDLILQSHLSLYQESYMLSTFVKSRASGEIKSAAQIPLDNNLLEQLKDGVRVLK